MKSELSAFIDDELADQQQLAVLSAIARDVDLRRNWDSYHLIGDALRRAPALDRQLTPRIMERLEREPALLAPRLRPQTHPLRTALALAATLAGVALVAWVALVPGGTQQLPILARNQVSTPAPALVRGAPSIAASSGRLQEYMVAHQTYSPANRILGATAYVRTVSAPVSGRSDDRAK